VRAGEPVVILDQSSLLIARDEAEAALAVAKAQLKKVLTGTRQEVVEQARARLNEAQALYDNASSELRRVKRLFEKGTVPKKLYDQAVAQYRAASAQLKAAREGLRMALKGATAEEVEVARAQVARAEVVLRRAEQALKDAVILAPFDGVVVKRFVNPGEYVSTLGKTPLLWLMSMDPIEAEVQIPELRLEEIEVGQPVEVRPDALRGQAFLGMVTKILPRVDPVSRTIKIKVEIPNPDLRLKAGMFCRVEIRAAARKGVVRIPKKALLHEEGQTVVFVRVGDRASKRAVTIGAVDETYAEVLRGLNVGEEVVVEGQHFLQEGTKITLTSKGQKAPRPS
jgi:multidrug efflux pump subunit AcrA (membrane-fusion protein)